jgi:PST family polysaccharide transporter
VATSEIPGQPATHTARWLGVTALGQGWRFIISLASAIILGRLLLPTDFGLLATLTPLIAVIDLIRDLGFTQAIIQRPNVTQAQSNGLFWISMAIAAGLSLILFASSPFVADFFNEPKLRALLMAQSFGLLLGACVAQPFAFLNRQLKFNNLSAIDCIGATVGLIVSVVGAVTLHSYWAIFLGGVAQTLMNLILSTHFSGWRPGKPTWDLHVTAMAKFGAGVSISNLANFMSRNTDNFLIAKADGPFQLGLYDRSYKLMLLPLTQITAPISRVLIPVLSRLSDDNDRYKDIYFKTITYVMIATQPGVIFALAFSRPLILALLGPRWSGVPAIFSWLALAGLHQLVTTSLNWLLISQGRARALAILSGYTSVTTVLSFLVGLPYGPVGVAGAYAISDYLIRVPVIWWVVGRVGPIKSRELLGCVAPHILACLMCGAVMEGLAIILKSPNLFVLALCSLPAYGAYLAGLAFFRSKRSLLIQAAPHVLAAIRRPA